MQPNAISAVVPVLNSKQYLADCLDSIIAAGKDHGPVELIVVDNGSCDGSYELLLSNYVSAAKIVQVKGTTISGVRNHGGRLATGAYICFIDSDCVVCPDYFRRVRETFAGTDAAATGCMVDLPPSPHWIEKTWQELHQPPRDGYVHFINSGNFVIKRSAFEGSLGFDETLITGEDAEYCQRLVAAGLKIYQSSAIQVRHLRNPKSVGAFFKKNVWHGLGMFGTFRGSWLDKPVLMTLVFLMCCAAGLLGLLLTRISLGARIAELVLLFLFAPTLTVAYRAIKARRLRRPLRSVLLYWLYYAARSYALFRIVLGVEREKGVAT